MINFKGNVVAGTSLSFAVFAFVVGFLLGLTVALLSAFRAKANRRVEEEREELLESITDSLKESFGSLSMEHSPAPPKSFKSSPKSN